MKSGYTDISVEDAEEACVFITEIDTKYDRGIEAMYYFIRAMQENKTVKQAIKKVNLDLGLVK